MTEKQVLIAREIATETVSLRSTNAQSLSHYIGKYAIITFVNDHEKAVGGIVEDIMYNELFEQKTVVFKVLYGYGVGIVEIPESNILYITGNISSEEELKAATDQLISLNMIRKGSFYFSYLGNVYVSTEILQWWNQKQSQREVITLITGGISLFSISRLLVLRKESIIDN